MNTLDEGLKKIKIGSSWLRKSDGKQFTIDSKYKMRFCGAMIGFKDNKGLLWKPIDEFLAEFEVCNDKEKVRRGLKMYNNFLHNQTNEFVTIRAVISDRVLYQDNMGVKGSLPIEMFLSTFRQVKD